MGLGGGLPRTGAHQWHGGASLVSPTPRVFLGSTNTGDLGVIQPGGVHYEHVGPRPPCQCRCPARWGYRQNDSMVAVSVVPLHLMDSPLLCVHPPQRLGAPEQLAPDLIAMGNRYLGFQTTTMARLSAWKSWIPIWSSEPTCTGSTR